MTKSIKRYAILIYDLYKSIVGQHGAAVKNDEHAMKETAKFIFQDRGDIRPRIRTKASQNSLLGGHEGRSQFPHKRLLKSTLAHVQSS